MRYSITILVLMVLGIFSLACTAVDQTSGPSALAAPAIWSEVAASTAAVEPSNRSNVSYSINPRGGDPPTRKDLKMLPHLRQRCPKSYNFPVLEVQPPTDVEPAPLLKAKPPEGPEPAPLWQACPPAGAGTD